MDHEVLGKLVQACWPPGVVTGLRGPSGRGPGEEGERDLWRRDETLLRVMQSGGTRGGAGRGWPEGTADGGRPGTYCLGEVVEEVTRCPGGRCPFAKGEEEESCCSEVTEGEAPEAGGVSGVEAAVEGRPGPAEETEVQGRRYCFGVLRVSP